MEPWGQTASEDAMPPDDATPPSNATPSDASTANGAHQQPQDEAGVTDAPAQHPPPPVDERDFLIPMPTPTTQDEAGAGVWRKLPVSGFPTAAELDNSVTCFHRYLGLYFMMAAALGTPILPAPIPKASSWLHLS
ncbi:hypothetical protein ColLi_12142 [Colletotrichum liriopes]|uniref:Uncharacterized protein n=1 Tax=Colletotrichum liriopes TaxID=708192 RepID=A0AA37LYH1_9PEZI|nr:hypothetical protein ColLi_12142 [Colletotrichum liriopes]